MLLALCFVGFVESVGVEFQSIGPQVLQGSSTMDLLLGKMMRELRSSRSGKKVDQ